MQMMALGLVILAAHLGGKVCHKLRMSEVTGQLVGGAMVGPFALHLLHLLPSGDNSYDLALESFHFFVFVFLGMVAFGIGEELHLSRLRQVGRAAVVICLIHVLITWVGITSLFYFGTRLEIISSFSAMPLWEAMLIGSIGTASAPAVTFVLMNQLSVEGRLRQMVGGIVVMADVMEVLLFSFFVQMAMREVRPEKFSAESSFLRPMLQETIFALLVGVAIYLALRLLVRRHAAHFEEEITVHHEQEKLFLHRILAEHPSPSAEILLIVMGTVSLGCGFAYSQHWPFLIAAILAGFMVANLHSHAIFDSLKIDNISPVMNLGFFALIGANISFAGLQWDTALMALMYVAMRFTGKYCGTKLGCRLMKEDPKISACLPSLMLPQAGVAAVEAVYVSDILQKPEISAIILPAIVFFEICGVYMVDRSLRLWRSWVADEEKALREVSTHSGIADAARLLHCFLGEAFVIHDCRGRTKSEVIEYLVDHARKKTDQHIDRSQALQVIGEREKLSPTGFGNNIAIPHCRLMGLGKPVLVLARHETGVVFGGVDEEPCHLILLILSAARNPGEHLKLLASTAHVLGNEEVRKRLLACTNSAQMSDLIGTLAREGNTGV
jgi:mannitol/fructose-specific phosphotransferase system IIA component (Ntr-type)/Kef-type K+ transport system membrane component KefB